MNTLIQDTSDIKNKKKKQIGTNFQKDCILVVGFDFRWVNIPSDIKTFFINLENSHFRFECELGRENSS